MLTARPALGLAVAAGILLSACSAGSPGSTGAGSTPGSAAGTTSEASSPSSASGTAATSPAASPSASASGASSAAAGAPTIGLHGTVVVIDPGHDGGNARHPEIVNRLVDSGNGLKACDTTGTETAGGYREADFTWDLAQRLAVRLRLAGAGVVLTRTTDGGVGPCITERAAIGNRVAAQAGRGVRVVAISLHADGGPVSGYGFHVIEPGRLPRNAGIVAPSRLLGTAVRDAFRAGTGEPFSTYTGRDGVMVRTDLGGLNLSTIPKVFLECGNMRNAADAGRLSSRAWRERAAAAIARGLTAYLRS